MKFHHVGIPTTQKRPGETFLAGAGVYITDPEKNPYRIEWLRFESSSGMPAELKTQTHMAYNVDDLAAAMKGKKVLIEPFEPMPGLKVAFVVDDGALIEFMQKTA